VNNETKDRPAPADDRRELAARPFFARFLEGTRAETGATTTTNMTLKYPSDRDEIDAALGLAPLSQSDDNGPRTSARPRRRASM
jgi:Serine endopeptidase inhibitors